MIKLTKLEEPDVLALNGATWLNTLESKLANGQEPTQSERSKYRHAEIKAILRDETHGKCAYCESYLLHMAFGDIEHVVPKSSDIAQTFRWENLTLACDICNTYKGNILNIIDPYVDDPASEFAFLGPMIVAKPESDKAVLTERVLKLNRSELLERRSERLRAIGDQMLVLTRTNDPELRDVIRADLEINEVGPDKEYSAFVRSMLTMLLPRII